MNYVRIWLYTLTFVVISLFIHPALSAQSVPDTAYAFQCPEFCGTDHSARRYCGNHCKIPHAARVP
jgi:hypothetical protein